MSAAGIRVTLCEYASVGKDGTFSVVRGGITQWTTPALPSEVDLYLLVELAPEVLPKGDFPLAVRWQDPGGPPVHLAQGMVTVTDPLNAFRFAVGSRVSARSWGACAYEVSVGGALRAAAPLLLINGGAESAAADGARERTAS